MRSTRDENLLDIKRLKAICEEREKKNIESTTLHFKVEKTTLNLEDLFRADMISNKAFVVDASCKYEDQSNDARLVDIDSILSYKFGVKETDPQSVKEKRYTCKCETDNIKATSGEYCPKCGTYSVEHKSIRGWLCIDGLKVFNPDMLTMFIKNKNKKKELKKPDNYRVSKLDPDKFPWLANPKFKYNILSLQDHEVLREFIKEYSKPEYLDYFLQRIDKFMTSKIPVVNKSHRHHQVVTKLDGTPDIKSHAINKYLMLISNKVYDLNNKSTHMSSSKKRNYLVSINKSFLSIYDEVAKIIGDGKSSDFRGRIGGRLKGNSSKVVIESMPSPVSMECSLSYASFGVMFLDWHYDLFVKHGLTAESEFRLRQMVPSRGDHIMLTKVLIELQRMDLAWITCYRAPVLYKQSLQGMYVSRLTEDGCIRVTEIALGLGFKGDKDGDTMLIFVLDPKVRLSIGFAFNARRAVYDPICGSIVSDFELPESAYFLVYKLFKESVELEDILEPDLVKCNDKEIRRSDDYGSLYDETKVKKFINKLNKE